MLSAAPATRAFAARPLRPFRAAFALALALVASTPLLLAQSGSGSASGSGSGGEGSGGTTQTYEAGTHNLGGGTVTFAQAIFNGGTVTNGTISASAFSGYSGIVEATLAGTGGLFKTTSGTLTLGGSGNTFTGDVSVTDGTLAISHVAQLGAGSALIIHTNGRLDAGSANLPLNRYTQVYNPGASLTTTGYIEVGRDGTGNLDVEGGATVTTGASVAFGVAFGAAATGIGVVEEAGTTLNVGTTLHLGAYGGTGTLTVQDGGTVTAGTLSFGTATGTGTLNLNSGGTLRVGGTNGIVNGGTAHLNLAGGTLQVTGTALTTSVPATLTNTSTIDTNALAATLSGVLSGTGALTKTGIGTLTLSAANTYTGTTTISAGTLALGSGGSIAGDIVNNATLAFARSDAVTHAGVISGTGAVTQSGTGTLALSGTNTYTGGTTVAAGNLTVSGLAQLGTGAVAVTGGTLHSTGAFAADRTISLSGASSLLTAGTSGVLAVLDIGFNSTGSLTLADGAAATGSWFTRLGVNAGGTGTVTVTGTGSTLTALGDLNLGTVGTGTLTVGSGGLVIATTGLTFGAAAGTGTLNLNSGGTLRVGGTNGLARTGTAHFNLAGGTVQVTGTALTTSVPATLTNTSTINTNGLATTFSGILSGTGALTKTGTGTLTLSGENTYAGGTTITGGTLAISNVEQLGTGSVALSGGGQLNGGTADLIFSRAVTATGAGTTLSTSGLFDFGAGAGNGSLTLSAGATATAGNTITFGTTGGSGTGLVTGTGSALTAANTLTLADGSLTIESGGTVTTAQLVLSSAGTLHLNSGGTLRVGGTDGIGGGAAGPSNFNIAGGTLQVTGSALTTFNGATLTHTATIDTNGLAATLQSALHGFGGLAKTGAGTLTLGSHNTYTGNTTLSAGTLALGANGNLETTPRITLAAGTTFDVSARAGGFTLASGQTLTGAGTVTGSLTVNGILSPGTSPGTLNTGATTVNSGGSLLWEINNATGTAGSNWDLLNITGALTIASTAGSPFSISLTSLLANNTAGNVLNFNSAASSTYTFASATGGIVGFSADKFSLHTAGFTNALNGGTWSLAQSGNDLNLNFTPSAIPEPSTYAALFGLTALALAARRRRQKK